jgi:oleandomycin transport system ATP-binding protein
MAEVANAMERAVGAEVAVSRKTGVAAVPVPDATLLPHVFRELDDRGIELAEFTLRKASLDEVFFALTGRRTDDSPQAGDRHEPKESRT